jgi:hypothetical protein
MNDDHEELEHIPWSELMAGDQPETRKLMYVGAGIVAALAFGMLVGRALWSPGGAEAVAVVADTVAEQTTSTAAAMTVESTVETSSTVVTAPAPEPAASAEPTTTAVAETEPPVMYSEADLRTVPEDAFVRTAMARAEWFVTDYFTADSGENSVSDILGALPAGTELPPMPQDGGFGVTYVEWARAFRVEPRGDGVYTVAVLYRSLASPEGDAYYRVRMRAVEVTVAVGPDGGTTVLDLPSPLSIPQGPPVSPRFTESIAPPGDVAAEAVAVASTWGADPSVLGATAGRSSCE